jgi:multicomponent Na+:H+ antiporter subunit D
MPTSAYSDTVLLLLPLLVPLVGAILAVVVFRSVFLQRLIGVLTSLATAGAAFAVLAAVSQGEILVAYLGDWPAPFGIVLVADQLAGLMLGVTGVIGVAVAIYALADIPRNLVRNGYFPLYLFLLMGVNGAFLAGDLFNLYVWFEVMLISSFVLMVLGGERDQLEGGLKYLVINLVSSMIFLIGVGVLYGKLGTLNMADVAQKIAASEDALLVNSSTILLLIAFGIKAALFPFFFWLPASYHTPRVAVSAVFAGLLTKVGVYALIRAYTLVFETNFDNVQGLFIALAAATMVTGVLGAASHFEIRRILSFHIVSQIGYMIMGLAIHTPLALAGAIFYMIHHIIVKTNLFLVGGLVERYNGTQDLARTGGLYQATPLLALLFFIPAFSLGGIPPLSGFWAKLGVIRAGVEAEAFFLVAVALVTGILTLFSMTKIWGEAFWKAHPSGEVPRATGTGRAEWVGLGLPVVFLAVITLWIGLAGATLWDLSAQAGAQILEPTRYIEAVLPPQAIDEG